METLAIIVTIGFVWFICDFVEKRQKFRKKKEDEEQERRFYYLMLMLSGVRTDNEMELFKDELNLKLEERDYDHERYVTLFRHYTEVNDLLIRIRLNDGGYILSQVNFEDELK